MSDKKDLAARRTDHVPASLLIILRLDDHSRQALAEGSIGQVIWGAGKVAHGLGQASMVQVALGPEEKGCSSEGSWSIGWVRCIIVWGRVAGQAAHGL